jgi:hypothetical protein
MVDTGRHPQMGFELQEPHSKVESVNEFVEKMAKGLEEAKVALIKAKDEYVQYYNHCRTHHQLGPYEVEKQIGASSYCIKLPPGLSCLHNVFPVVKLSLAKPNPFPSHVPPLAPPAELIDGEEEFEVEKILDSCIWYRRLEYLSGRAMIPCIIAAPYTTMSMHLMLSPNFTYAIPELLTK